VTVQQATTSTTVGTLFLQRAEVWRGRPAITEGARTRTYGELGARVRKLASMIESRGIARGDRIAILSENRGEYLEVFLASALVGAIVACQNWRLAEAELAHCVSLVEPKLAFVSPRYEERFARVAPVASGVPRVAFGEGYENAIANALEIPGSREVSSEDPLLILYTSGTTGLPKGAVLSHRAQIQRNLVLRAEFGIAATDAYVVWSPLYHMGGAEYSLGTLMSGGEAIVVDGFDRARLAELVATRELGWLLLMPGMVSGFIEELRAKKVVPRGVKVCGVMADLVPRAEIAEITRLLGAPYANTFGATETGCPPCSSSLVPIGVAPEKLSKEQSPYCEVRLVDANDVDVPDGAPGELLMRGPTLFSGYWNAPETNAREFRDGWFHMGDVFVRNADGTLDFVDRVKYLIKSGGENVYPAEIERVLLAEPRVLEAAVVRRPDAKWGEVPVAFVAKKDDALTADDLRARCRELLAGYKQPKEIHFIAEAAFPRSASGKVQRHELEKLVPRGETSS
jgi:fatty-acyl-CoA synthase